MSGLRRVGLFLAVFLLSISAWGSTVESCVTYACSFQEQTSQEAAPQCVLEGPAQNKADMLGEFAFGVPVAALISFALFRARKAAVAQSTLG